MTRLISWNIGKRKNAWRELARMSDVDVALLQESTPPPADIAGKVEIGDPATWDSHGWNSDWWRGQWPRLYDRWPMVVRLSNRVTVERFRQVSPISIVEKDEIAVSGIGTIAAARVTPKNGGKSFIVASMYARWLKPHPTTPTSWGVGYSDASAHRVISDLSAFIGSEDPSKHRIIAAGDLNAIYGTLDDNPLELPERSRSVFARMEALGLCLVGPRHPHGRRANPTPKGVPADTVNAPTYYTTAQTPAMAENQLDYVFASRGFHETVRVKALNEADEWGPSDHCRIEIDIADAAA